MDDPANRDAAGRFGNGNQANPSGRPKAFKEYQSWLASECLGEIKNAYMRCLRSDDEKVVMMAVKEGCDRLFGKAPQTILGEDGKPLLSGFGAELLAALANLKK